MYDEGLHGKCYAFVSALDWVLNQWSVWSMFIEPSKGDDEQTRNNPFFLITII